MNFEYWSSPARTLEELTIKLMEEIGEVAAEVGKGRKLRPKDRDNLIEELNQVTFLSLTMQSKLTTKRRKNGKGSS